eukprot:2484267-Alexandrium_andersonii.AAC.1
MVFGKYKKKSLQWIVDNDPAYINSFLLKVRPWSNDRNLPEALKAAGLWPSLYSLPAGQSEPAASSAGHDAAEGSAAATTLPVATLGESDAAAKKQLQK